MTPRIALLGDAALVVTLGDTIDAGVNARVHALAAALREQPLSAGRQVEIVPAMSSLTMHVPAGTAVGLLPELEARAMAIAGEPVPDRFVAGAVHEIRVRYGGEAGPDLRAVAGFAGCTPHDAAERHAASIYRVYMLGFLPGFAYLGDVDASIAAPRRAEPRMRVPAGSIGIAGSQTGVYPQDSPGGWQLVGQTAAVMFDPATGALLQPGDRVRFVIEDIA